MDKPEDKVLVHRAKHNSSQLLDWYEIIISSRRSLAELYAIKHSLLTGGGSGRYLCTSHVQAGRQAARAPSMLRL